MASSTLRSTNALVLSACLWGTALVATCHSAGGQAQQGSISTEFGKIVAFGQRSIDIQVYDRQRHRVVQHGFLLSKETHEDTVHVGDAVEVTFSFNAAGERSLAHLTRLPAGAAFSQIPEHASAPELAPGATGARPSSNVLSDRVHTAVAATVPAETRTTKVPKASDASLAAVAPAKKAVPSPTAVSLSGDLKPVLHSVQPLSLGAPGPASSKAAPTVKTVLQDAPAEECHRSDAAWPTAPVQILVIDFRYPVEREEAHDTGSTGGGSGTAIADLVFSRMETLEQADARFAFSRGDRRRLDRTDFAGAARTGRELGADAVLAGTFVPILEPGTGDETPATRYELRAGLVDACSGQLLLRLSSVSCPAAPSPGLDPGITAPGMAPCQRFQVTAAEAADPKRFAADYRPALDALLYPMEHDGAPRTSNGSAELGSAGIVAAVEGDKVTIRLAPGTHLKAGEQVGIHARRLAKNPATYTLHELHDEEIGRLTVGRAAGDLATGSFKGDFLPRPGDTAELLQPE